MRPYESLCVLEGPYAFLWNVMGPFGCLCVFLGPYKSF